MLSFNSIIPVRAKCTAIISHVIGRNSLAADGKFEIAQWPGTPVALKCEAKGFLLIDFKIAGEKQFSPSPSCVPCETLHNAKGLRFDIPKVGDEVVIMVQNQNNEDKIFRLDVIQQKEL